MSRTLTISDELYDQLESEVRKRGFETIEQLLRTSRVTSNGVSHREEVVRQIDNLRSRLFAEYGQMPDSVELIREDRAR
jgi:hypothetical protein